MERYYIWRKEIFNSHYQIYAQNEIKGSLIFNHASNSARGIAAKNYYFMTQGYLHPVTVIRDENFTEIGKIEYHFWKLKASVHLTNQTHAFWQFGNGRLSQWSITSNNAPDSTGISDTGSASSRFANTTQIRYKSKTGAGWIQSDIDDELLLLTGLYIREFFSRATLILLLLVLFALLLQQI